MKLWIDVGRRNEGPVRYAWPGLRELAAFGSACLRNSAVSLDLCDTPVEQVEVDDIPARAANYVDDLRRATATAAVRDDDRARTDALGVNGAVEVRPDVAGLVHVLEVGTDIYRGSARQSWCRLRCE
jgi:hypothetical protein